MGRLDLLEIDRLERALARRPRLAERLFTDAERAYAAAQARPAQHLAARFCAKEAVSKALVDGRAGPRATSRSWAPAAAAARAPARRASRAARRSSASSSHVSLTHTRTTAARGGARSHDALPDWLEPCPTPSACAPTDAWAIEERGIPALELMERAGAGLARVVAGASPEGAIAVVCGKGNNGGDGWSPRACCARPAATCRAGHRAD